MIPHNLPTPDYEETSFIGRKQEQLRLLKMLDDSGDFAQPITISGAAGVGKTSLAAKVAYLLAGDDVANYAACI